MVVFALFYTKQLTIFQNLNGLKSSQPDFWRTTLLCIVAGAFSDKIYDAVSTRVDRYVETDKPKQDQPNQSLHSDGEGYA